MPASLRSAQTAGRSSFLTPSMSMRWPPVTFTVGMSNLSTTSAMARSSLALVTPAPHARHDGIGAVLLDVGVHALVDEARLIVVGVFARPVADEIVVERRAALGAAARGLPLELLHQRRDRLQALGLDQAAHVVVAERRCRRTSAARRPDCRRRRASSFSSCSTRPVQEPQEADALVWARTSSSEVRPLLAIAP